MTREHTVERAAARLTPEQVAWTLGILREQDMSMAVDELEDLDAVEKAADADEERDRQEFAQAIAQLTEARKVREAAHRDLKGVISETRSRVVRWRATKLLWQQRAAGMAPETTENLTPAAAAENAPPAAEARPRWEAGAYRAQPAAEQPAPGDKPTVLQVANWPGARIAGD